jgi:hypothetical protein
MNRPKSDLAGNSKKIYSIKSENSRDVEITENQLIVENYNSGERSLQLDKIFMIKKRKPRVSDGTSMKGALSFILGVSGMFSGFLAFSSSDLFGIEPLSVTSSIIVTGLLLTGSLVLYLYSKLEDSDNEPPEDEYFINVRASEGGVGFVLKSGDINQFMSQLQNQINNSVQVKDNT